MKKLDGILEEVAVEQAVGLVLAHDLTQILPGQFKGRLFKKGHVIREEDIPALLSIGKEHIYTLRLQSGFLHEDEAALRLAQAAAGPHIELTPPHEGKITLKSTIHGLAKLDKKRIDRVNSLDQIIMSTIRSNAVVLPGRPLMGTRVIPLVIEEERVAAAEAIIAASTAPLIEVKPFRRMRVGLITTGSEVFKGRIADKFGPVVRSKVEALGSEIIEQRLAPDDSDVIAREIRRFLEEDRADLILLTGGMSVDPDDRTPGAIKQAGADIVSYGTPMLPGSMLLIGYLDGVPVMGLPGCVMHDPYTSFDVLLPRVCAGEVIVREDISELGYGGLQGC
ncbi:molybdenum cofactor synthesis domain-containing protein [Paenibacillus sp. UNCCL117]|uniref:molybdopterin-binding protein n=1 Tax=unclassified Paenibacillus TaxID=185978 RepID=UPI0008887DB2|nr:MULTISPECIES: molybdopterin-binding protein [unclassified Paenibacillus]SDD90943.1 molybdenum cofactor synthesis domain-containing protein [Paenibacillus sp. cl123]SFW43809.1 molybdenum cofactor synthesis domain-containing protein [Paenibacillus sp. UNCCL117]